MDPHFDVAGFLAAHRETIVERASTEVGGQHLPRYEAAGPEEVAKRLTELFDVVVEAAGLSRLDAALAYANAIAAARQQSGHALSEIQRAINALEVQLWTTVLDGVPADSQGYALGVVSTVLGAIKDRVACEYVSRAASKPMHTLRIDELFRGTAAGDF